MLSEYFQFWQAKAMFDLISFGIMAGVILIGSVILIGFLIIKDKIVEWLRGRKK